MLPLQIEVEFVMMLLALLWMVMLGSGKVEEHTENKNYIEIVFASEFAYLRSKKVKTRLKISAKAFTIKTSSSVLFTCFYFLDNSVYGNYL